MNSIELLRDYGIYDQFTTLVNGQSSSVVSGAGATGTSDKKTQQNNWTTFD